MEEVAEAVGGRLLSVTNAIEAGACHQGDSGWPDALEGGGSLPLGGGTTCVLGGGCPREGGAAAPLHTASAPPQCLPAPPAAPAPAPPPGAAPGPAAAAAGAPEPAAKDAKSLLNELHHRTPILVLGYETVRVSKDSEPVAFQSTVRTQYENDLFSLCGEAAESKKSAEQSAARHALQFLGSLNLGCDLGKELAAIINRKAKEPVRGVAVCAPAPPPARGLC